MSTPTDLRHALAAYAEDATDLPAAERISAVHGRVRVVRRRRRGAVALATVAAVVGVGAVAWLPDSGPEPLQRPTVGGHTAPATMTSLGYGYRFADADTGDGSAHLDLAASDRPRIVSWAATGSGPVRLRSDVDLGSGETPDVSDRSARAFDDFVAVPTGVAVDLRAQARGRVGLAVYTLAAPAPGLTADGVTWRDTVAGGRRIAAAVGRPGQADVSTSFTMPAGVIGVGELCASAPAGTWFHIAFSAARSEQAFSFGACDRSAPSYDASAGNLTTFDDGISDDAGREVQPGETVPVRVWATRGDDGPLVDDPRLMIGAAVYAVPASDVSIAGYDQPQEVEAYGHLWRLRDTRLSQPGDRRLDARVASDGTPVLVRAVTSRTGRGEAYAGLTGQTRQGAHNALDDGSSTFTLGVVSDRSVAAEVRVTQPTSRTQLGVLVYEQAD